MAVMYKHTIEAVLEAMLATSKQIQNYTKLKNVHSSAIILRMYVSNAKTTKFLILETFRAYPGKSLKVHFNLFLRILANESEKK